MLQQPPQRDEQPDGKPPHSCAFRQSLGEIAALRLESVLRVPCGRPLRS